MTLTEIKSQAKALLAGEDGADRIVPPSGFTVRLTLMTAAAMAFLAIFALALSSSAGRVADRWGNELARASTVRISAPSGEVAAQTVAALRVLTTTPGVASARALEPAEQRALLAPWFGPDLPIESLPVPQLIEITETAEGYDAAGLRLRLSAEVPGAVLDDHTRWRRPLQSAASRLRLLSGVVSVLIAAATAAMVMLAAYASLAANAQVIRVLRLVGATDDYIAGAFVRRFTYRTGLGAAVGSLAGLIGVVLLRDAPGSATVLGSIGFAGLGWIWPFVIPVLAAGVAYWATRTAARRVLERLN